MLRQWRVLVFPFFNVLLNGFNFFFHISASWYLTEQQYGQANALLALFALLSVLGLSVQLMAAKLVSQNKPGAGLPGGAFLPSLTALLAAGTFVALAVLHPLLGHALAVGRGPLFLLYAVVSLHIIVSLFRGIMQGKERLQALNINFYLEAAGKLAVFFSFVPHGLQLWQLMLALGAGMLLSLAHGLVMEWGSLRGGQGQAALKHDRPWKPLSREWGNTLLMNVFVLFFTSVDMLAVQHYAAEDAGIYAIALKYSQLVYFVSFSVIAVLIPKIGAQAGNLPALRTILLWFGGFMAVCAGMVYAGAAWLFPLSLPLLFGPAYVEAARYLPLGGAVYWLFSVVLFFVHVHVLTGRRRFMLWMAAGAAALVLSFGLWHRTPDELLLAQVVIYGLFAAGFITDAVIGFRRIKERALYENIAR
ncbi:lipopolysaccharide biosynthesis protein [Paenibacillus sp. HW567]|uniref:lipopolysaccharide biosynthesis protein n=1 Tax=Paenibacillus sp. HW567 TaxID=1034769 RepID=UPI00048D821D|nr:oligosaccharide flippase family protein [Paenibacillus sp. HW567]